MSDWLGHFPLDNWTAVIFGSARATDHSTTTTATQDMSTVAGSTVVLQGPAMVSPCHKRKVGCTNLTTMHVLVLDLAAVLSFTAQPTVTAAHPTATAVQQGECVKCCAVGLCLTHSDGSLAVFGELTAKASVQNPDSSLETHQQSPRLVSLVSPLQSSGGSSHRCLLPASPWLGELLAAEQLYSTQEGMCITIVFLEQITVNLQTTLAAAYCILSGIGAS